MVAADLFDVAVLIDQVLRVLRRDVLAGYLDRLILNRDRPLRYIVVRRLTGDMLSLLDNSKLLLGVNGFDLIPGKSKIAGHIAVKGQGSIGLPEQFTSELITIGQHQHVRRWRRRLTECLRAKDHSRQNG